LGSVMGIKQWLGLASLLGTATLCGCQSDNAVKRNPQTTPQNASWDKTRTTQPSPTGPGGFSTSTGNPGMSPGAGGFGTTTPGTQPGFGAGTQPGTQPGASAFPNGNGNGAVRPLTGTGSPTGASIQNSSPYYGNYGNPPYPSQPSSSGFAAPPSSFPGAGNPGSTLRTTAGPTISEPPAPQFPGSAPSEPTSLGGVQSVPPVPPQPGAYPGYNR
jgi:hypothetical protein